MKFISKFKMKYKGLFSNISFIKLLLANNISRLGDSIDMVAYGWMVYQLTHSEILLGTIFFVNGLPGIILSPFVGVLVDHLPKKWICVIGNSTRGLVVTITAILYFLNVLEIWQILLFTLINSSIETMVSPSNASIFSIIVDEEHYLKVSSLSQSIASTIELIGFGVAAVIIASVGVFGAILIDGITFFISSLILLSIIFEDKRENQKLNLKTYFYGLKSGFMFVYKKKIILLSILLLMMTNLFTAPIGVLMPVYVEKVIKTSAVGLSMFSIGLSLGTIIGGIIISMFNKAKKSLMIVFGCSFIGLLIIGLSIPGFAEIPIISPLIFATILFFFIGLCLVFITTPIKTYLLKHTPKEMMGRVFSLISMITLSMSPISGALSGTLAEFIPLSLIYLLMGVGIIFVSFLPMLNKTFRRE